MKTDFYTKYFKTFTNLIQFDQKVHKKLDFAVQEILKLRNKKNKIIIFGNGGSSSIASHVAIDLTKNTKVKTIPMTDPALITCFSNDFNHENWMKKAIEHYHDKGDLIIIISSSGMSKNITNAAKYCVNNKIKMITLSGMKKNNNLKLINIDGINFWINSMIYNHVELAHLYLLLLIVDKIISLRSKIKK